MGHWILQHVNKIACLNGVEKSYAQDFGATDSQIFDLPNGISLPDPHKDLSTINFRAEFKIPADSKIILFLGRLHQKKGIDLLVEAFNQLQDFSAHLILAGSDHDYRHKLEDIIHKHGLAHKVHFTGFVDGDRKLALLQACDVMVLASRLEGLPVTVLEAMAARKPVIISQACNLPEVAKVKAGIEIENDRVDALVQALRDFLSMPVAMHLDMGNNGFNLVKDNFSWDQITKNYIHEMQTLISNQGTSR